MNRTGLYTPSQYNLFGKSKSHAKTGFTLIELLVVVSIIALLVSILLPALSKARDSAKNALCGTNLRQIGVGLYMYAVDNNDRLPPAYGPFPCHHNLLLDIASTAAYDNDPELFRDAENPLWGLGPIYVDYLDDNIEVFKCPTEVSESFRTETNLSSYTYRDYDFASNDSRNIRYSIHENPSEPIVADRMRGWYDSTTERIDVHRYWSGGNVLYIGGHVEWFITPDGGGYTNSYGAWKPYGSMKPEYTP